MSSFLTEARAIAPDLAALRHAFHRRPEIGNHEFETAARIEATLRDLGIPARRVLDTAVVARLEGGLPGKTVALRADMDALPLAEATGADFASENPGRMHACGHDAHTAMMLGVAKKGGTGITDEMHDKMMELYKKTANALAGYFDIEIDPSNVEVSYDYRIDLSYDTQNLPDLVVSEYAILDEDYVEGDSVTPVSIVNNTITGSFDYDNMTDNFSYSTFTVRIYFKWYEGEDESMNDAADTLIGSNAANSINTTFDVTANISFNQKLS